MNDVGFNTILSLAVRHALTTLAGALATHGYLQASTGEQFVAGGMLILGVVWSWWQKEGEAGAKAFLQEEADRYRSKLVIAQVQAKAAAKSS